MKFLYVGIITIFLVIAVVFTGCTDSAASAPSVTNLQITPNVAETRVISEATTSSQPTTTVQATVTANPVKIFNGEYHWVEYRLNSSTTMPPNPRFSWEYTIKMERSRETYKNNPAVHYKITTISDYSEWVNQELITTKNGLVFVDDSYYNGSTYRFLGKTYSETIKGVEKPVGDDSTYYSQHYREERPAGWLGITPFSEMNITLTDLGTESVTVPAGTYRDARKYTGKFHDETPITFWVAPGIPVPVRYEFPYKEMDGVNPFFSYELKGWG